MTYRVSCRVCNEWLAEGVDVRPNEIGPCSKCGSAEQEMLVLCEEKQPMSDGDFSAVGTDSNGVAQIERVTRQVHTGTGEVATDRGKPSLMWSNLQLDKVADERRATVALVKAMNFKYNWQYQVLENEAKDDRGEDQILGSTVDEPNRIIVQVRHLDETMAGEVGRAAKSRKTFSGSRELSQLTQAIENAIIEKSQVDKGSLPTTILLLHLPAPIGQILREEIEKELFDFRGFYAVWIYPTGEECFELSRKDPKP